MPVPRLRTSPINVSNSPEAVQRAFVGSVDPRLCPATRGRSDG
jgi:hypothetical protein